MRARLGSLAFVAPVLALALAGSCYSPAPENGVLLCSTDKKCPDGYHCAVTDRCWLDGMDPPGPAATAADRCGSDIPVQKSSDNSFNIDTTGFKDDFSQLMGCTPRNEPGNDAFFAVDMAQNERWHFHVKVPQQSPEKYDPAVYILPSCDDRACVKTASQDECGAGRDEHLSFIAPTAGRYFIGVDSALTPGAAVWSVFAIHPVCGNKSKEHSESCDDGNAKSGDGCSADCATEVGEGGMEGEPNDDAIGANPLRLAPDPVGKVQVGGSIKNGCDFDVYAVTVPAGGSVEATVLDGSGLACTGATKLKLELIAPDRSTVRGAGVAPGDNTCPVIGADTTMFKFAQGLAAGTFYLKLSHIDRGSGETVAYQLRVETRSP